MVILFQQSSTSGFFRLRYIKSQSFPSKKFFRRYKPEISISNRLHKLSPSVVLFYSLDNKFYLHLTIKHTVMAFQYEYQQQGSASPTAGASAGGAPPTGQPAQQPSASPAPYPNNSATGSSNGAPSTDAKTTLW